MTDLNFGHSEELPDFFSSGKNMSEAMDDDLEYHVLENNLRSKRSERFYWTDQAFEMAEPLLASPSSESLNLMSFNPLLAKRGTHVRASINVANRNEYPFSTFGKFGFKIDGAPHSCSFAFVKKNLLLTSAHCVKSYNCWYDNFKFYKNYNGIRDKGREVAWIRMLVPARYDKIRADYR